jgi:ABC-2 type transport system ATP-binding protein
MTTTEVLGTGPAAARPAGMGVFASGVRRSFGPVEAVRSIDLTAPVGEVTALVGPNGAGKTTLLLILASLLMPDAGTISVGGHDPAADPDAVRAVTGWMPDFFGVYENLTAREYLEYGAAAYRLPRAAARDRAAELLGVVHLAEHADRPVHMLSRGQKQRLGVARALVHRPRVLLLDEPAGGLDPRSRAELRDLLRALAAGGAAVVVSSHVLGELEEMADRAVFVDRGVTAGEQRIAELAGARGRPWRLRALDVAALTAALDRRGVGYRAPEPAGVIVEIGGEAEAAQLLATLVGDGVPVTACAPATGALEAAYLQLTGQDRR